MLSSADFLTLAEQHGYGFMTPELLRVWVHRKLFPRHTDTFSPPGVRQHYALWPAQAADHFLALCFQHEQNSRTDAIQLGLWLQGYPLPDGQDTIPHLLTGQIQRLWEQVSGLPAITLTALADGTMPDEAREASLDTLCAHLMGIVSTSAILDFLAWGVALRDDRADTSDVATDRTLQTFNYPRQVDADHAIFPNPAVPESRRQELGSRAVFDALLCLLGVNPSGDPSVNGSDYRAIDYDPDRQLISLPGLMCALRDAGQAELQMAQGLAFSAFMDAITRPSVTEGIEGAPRLDFAQVMESYRHNSRFLFGSPKLAPLAAYLVAASIVFHRGPHSLEVRYPQSVLALKLLHDTTRRPGKAEDAALAVLLSICVESSL